jgi:crotonobetainyl-CoA:carnitine CoA-transferase CaiB-like acyl-CoA transferase
VADVFEHPQAKARGLELAAEHPTAGSVRTTGFPYELSKTPAEVHQAPPLLGEHTDEVLTHLLGYLAPEVADLKERGVV